MGWSQGEYNPINPQKVIGIEFKKPFYRSGWERTVMLSLDQNPKVLRWGSETHKIPYNFSLTESKRNYYVDFYVEMLNSKNTIDKFLIEVKPDSQTRLPAPPKNKNFKAQKNYNYRLIEFKKNQDKWKFANSFSRNSNIQFIITTEKGIYIVQENGLKKISDKNFF